ncbi:D-arabinono-1,4-lactone oxidase [Microbulbifer sp. JMSA004]|uniref:D-arabinono-1,4-lactone oxidase n=1 Tax=unclassified Microbulbifer TaxID=2619833 RepID=UPI0024ACA58E|nr:D-arabinono-1,4-lactone oxidase [Microbulbifer sp. VAAF005]WHI47087.1 D-arabinono-1,4-lactone oxidase [Microbulbifer sp. VAAF005]
MGFNRRQFINSIAIGSASLAAAPISSVARTLLQAAAPPTKKAGVRWRNWSGSQECLPAHRLAPKDIPALQTIIAEAQGTVRAVGAGHSFTALVPTDDTIISLGRITGVADHDSDKVQATIYAGTRVADIGQPLEDIGQALINQPDIDEQTLGGCLATATHGTGAGLGCMSSYAAGMELVTAGGDTLWCDGEQNPEVFAAAQVSLGSLGMVTKVRMQNQPSYRLRRESWVAPLEEVLDQATALAEANRNFEFYYIPFSGMCMADSHQPTTEEIFSTEREDTNEAVMTLKSVRDWLGWSPKLRQFALQNAMEDIEREVVVESSWRNYASERNVRFNEMEYHLPREDGLKAFAEIRRTIEENNLDVFFPIEVRFVKADDIWLSPFYKQDSVSIAIHRYFEEDHLPLFQAIEPIMRKYGGRPHWGKLNKLQGSDFAELYPQWQDFLEVRRELDPSGKFLNPYLKTLFT